MIYIRLEEAHFQKANDEFICKVAKTVNDAKPLIEAGFEYVCDMNGVTIFKKQK